MKADDDLFALSPNLSMRFERLGGKIPVLICDEIYARPDEIRQVALRLAYRPPPVPYPGRLAVVEEPNTSLAAVTEWILGVVNGDYLKQVPIALDGRRISGFAKVYTDFAKVELHPTELSLVQRLPHKDPVAIFGLIYLNHEERGGTLFFQPTQVEGQMAPPEGYFTDNAPGFELCGRIEGRFNRLAIYPGFVPHSGEINGDWILGDERFSSPRLTQRFLFYT